MKDPTDTLLSDNEKLVNAFRAALDNDEEDVLLLLMRMPETLRAPWLAVQMVNIRKDFANLRKDVHSMATPGHRTQAIMTALGAGFGGALIILAERFYTAFIK